MNFIDIDIDGLVYRAQMLDGKAPDTASAIWDALPFSGRVVHEQVSGAMLSTHESLPIDIQGNDTTVGFQHPGLVILDPGTNRLAICYGQGRLNSASGPTEALPVAQMGGDLTAFAELGFRLQFDGAKPITLRKSDDQTSALALAPEPEGRKLKIEFGDAVITATLLESVSPRATTAFANLLPLTGTGNNTHSSGSLTRFWNPDGGPEGETVLDVENLDEGQVILYPGYIYYLPKVGFRGLRIPRDASMMRSSTGGGGSSRLVPLAKFDGDWTAFRDQADRVAIEGAKPMSISLAE